MSSIGTGVSRLNYQFYQISQKKKTIKTLNLNHKKRFLLLHGIYLCEMYLFVNVVFAV